MWKSDPNLGYAALGQWSFALDVESCAAKVRVIERRAEIGYIRGLNVMVPDTGTILIAFANQEQTDWGELWLHQGMVYDLLAGEVCSAVAAQTTKPKPPIP